MTTEVAPNTGIPEEDARAVREGLQKLTGMIDLSLQSRGEDLNLRQKIIDAATEFKSQILALGTALAKENRPSAQAIRDMADVLTEQERYLEFPRENAVITASIIKTLADFASKFGEK